MSDHEHDWIRVTDTRGEEYGCSVTGCQARCAAIPEAPIAGRYGIAIIDTEPHNSVKWCQPFDDEDSATDPDEPEMRAALFATHAAAEAGVARRIRYEARPLPQRTRAVVRADGPFRHDGGGERAGSGPPACNCGAWPYHANGCPQNALLTLGRILRGLAPERCKLVERTYAEARRTIGDEGAAQRALAVLTPEERAEHPLDALPRPPGSVR